MTYFNDTYYDEPTVNARITYDDAEIIYNKRFPGNPNYRNLRTEDDFTDGIFNDYIEKENALIDIKKHNTILKIMEVENAKQQ